MNRVLVFGDVIEDVYRECSYRKRCPDAHEVPVYVQTTIESVPGGAANVAINLAALSPDVRVDLIGNVGQLARLVKQRSRNRVEMSYSLFMTPPFRKERIIRDGLLDARIDDRPTMTAFESERLADQLEDYLKAEVPDLIIVADYAGGALSTRAQSLLMGHRDRLLVDTKLTDLSPLSGCMLIKLNSDELSRVIIAGEHSPQRHCGYLVVTHGSGGSTVLILQPLGVDSSQTHTLTARAHDVPVVDVCGCGDTFMAGLAASLLRGSDVYTAMQFANAAAATVVTESRVAVADLAKTLTLLGRNEE